MLVIWAHLLREGPQIVTVLGVSQVVPHSLWLVQCSVLVKVNEIIEAYLSVCVRVVFVKESNHSVIGLENDLLWSASRELNEVDAVLRVHVPVLT